PNILQRLKRDALAHVNLRLRAGDTVVDLQCEVPVEQAEGLPWLEREGLELAPTPFRSVTSWALRHGEVARWSDEDTVAPVAREVESLEHLEVSEDPAPVPRAEGHKDPSEPALGQLIYGALAAWMVTIMLGVLGLLVAHFATEDRWLAAGLAATPVMLVGAVIARTQRKRDTLRRYFMAMALAYAAVGFALVATVPDDAVPLTEVGGAPFAYTEHTDVSQPDEAIDWEMSASSWGTVNVALVDGGDASEVQLATACAESQDTCMALWQALEDASWSVRAIQPVGKPRD